MPFGDPGGNYASGGAVNQGGPSGPNSPGNMGGGGGNQGGSNVRSAYGATSPNRIGSGAVRFGWQPSFSGQYSPDTVSAFTDPDAVNYTDTPRIGNITNHSSYGPFGGIASGMTPRGAGGSNSGQGGMGAGRRQMLARALSGGRIGSGGR